MTPKEIKRILFDRDMTIKGLAEQFGCQRKQLSMCIHRDRVYPDLRKKLARRLGIPVAELFSEGAAPDKRAA